MLSDAGFNAVHESEEKTDLVVINTCGFIGDAKEESINTIMEFVNAKNEGDVKEIYVMGCLSERYRQELQNEIPEVDKFYGKFDWTTLASDLIKRHIKSSPFDRTLTTPSHYTYLKISEGCNRFCAFCAIPIITGRHKSRPMEEIEGEVRTMVQRGVKEFKIMKWIRLHYAYPAQFPYDILAVMRKHENVCSYLDIALQHISDNVLAKMKRHISADETRSLLSEMRQEVPGIHIRTTLMVGFPGETEEDFQETLEVVRKVRYDSAFTFIYSKRTGTLAAGMDNQIPENIVKDRFDRLLKEVQDISRRMAERFTGTDQQVLVEEPNSQMEGYLTGRLSNNHVVHFRGNVSLIGSLVNVHLDECRGFYYMGRLVN